MQTALTRAYLRWDRIVDEDPEGYVRRTLINAHIDWWRRRPWREEPTAAARAGGGRQSASTRARRCCGARDLSRRQRAVVVLRYYEGMSEADIAPALGCSAGTVKSAASRATVKLRELPARRGAVMDLTTDLRDAMRSPDLALEPSASLEEGVRRSARGLRFRRRAGGAVLALAALSTGGLVLPGLLPDDARRSRGRAGGDRAYRTPPRRSPARAGQRRRGGRLLPGRGRLHQRRARHPSARVDGPQRAGVAPRFPTVFDGDRPTVDDRRFLAGTVWVPGRSRRPCRSTSREGEPIRVTAVERTRLRRTPSSVELPPARCPLALGRRRPAGTTIATRDLTSGDAVTRPVGAEPAPI